LKDLVGNPEGERSLGNDIHNVRIILQQILNKWDGGTWTEFGGGGGVVGTRGFVVWGRGGDLLRGYFPWWGA